MHFKIISFVLILICMLSFIPSALAEEWVSDSDITTGLTYAGESRLHPAVFNQSGIQKIIYGLEHSEVLHYTMETVGLIIRWKMDWHIMKCMQ